MSSSSTSARRHAYIGNSLDAAANRQRRALARSERVDRRADRVVAMAELLDVDRRGAVLGAIVEGFEVHFADRLTQQILERVVIEAQWMCVLPIVGDGDEVFPRLLSVVCRVLDRRRQERDGQRCHKCGLKEHSQQG